MHKPDSVKHVIRMKVENSLKQLQTDYLDALLMHWPYPDFFQEIWHEMELLYEEGIVRSIGVCNCRQRHFEKLRQSCLIFPMLNQFESSPINSKEELVNYCKSNNVQVMIYSPLMNLRLQSRPEYHELLQNLAAKYTKSKAQIVLRFDVQRGMIPIPKSTHRGRIESNIGIFDFSLTDEEMQRLLNCNENRQYMPESRSCPGF